MFIVFHRANNEHMVVFVFVLRAHGGARGAGFRAERTCSVGPRPPPTRSGGSCTPGGLAAEGWRVS